MKNKSTKVRAGIYSTENLLIYHMLLGTSITTRNILNYQNIKHVDSNCTTHYFNTKLLIPEISLTAAKISRNLWRDTLGTINVPWFTFVLLFVLIWESNRSIFQTLLFSNSTSTRATVKYGSSFLNLKTEKIGVYDENKRQCMNKKKQYWIAKPKFELLQS